MYSICSEEKVDRTEVVGTEWRGGGKKGGIPNLSKIPWNKKFNGVFPGAAQGWFPFPSQT